MPLIKSDVRISLKKMLQHDPNTIFQEQPDPYNSIFYAI